MIRTQYARFKESTSTLRKLFERRHDVLFIHYSCESFYDRPAGTSPRITSLAVRFLGSGQTISFSIHQQAELDGVATEVIYEQYDQLEKKMLDAFYGFVERYSGCQWVHWNMRDANYGFEAISHRYRVLGGKPTEIQDSNKIDLARALHDVLGPKYIEHPRLYRLLERNEMVPRNLLSGEEEATAFENSEYVRLHQSTLSKVDALMNVAEAALTDRLQCNNGYFKRRGMTLSTVVLIVKDHPIFAVVSIVAVIVGLVIGVIKLLDNIN